MQIFEFSRLNTIKALGQLEVLLLSSSLLRSALVSDISYRADWEEVCITDLFFTVTGVCSKNSGKFFHIHFSQFFGV